MHHPNYSVLGDESALVFSDKSEPYILTTCTTLPKRYEIHSSRYGFKLHAHAGFNNVAIIALLALMDRLLLPGTLLVGSSFVHYAMVSLADVR